MRRIVDSLHVTFIVLALAGLTGLAVGAAPVPPQPVVAAFTNEHAVLEFDRLGRIARLADRQGGDTLAKVHPISHITDTNGVTRHVSTLSVKDGLLRFAFYDWKGMMDLRVRTESWGFVFTVEKCTLEGKAPVASHVLFRVIPTAAFARGYGSILNGASSDTHTIALRGYETECASRTSVPVLDVRLPGEFDPVGKRFALVLAKHGAETIACLKQLTLDAGYFHTKCGGAWSLEAPENRRSYLFAHFAHDSIDDWIDLAERGGFSTLHASGWWKSLGHYEPNPAKFPRGEADLKDCIDRARAAGLCVSTHTLCSGISFRDSWITPVCNTNLLALYRYTLAEPLAENATELVVAEKPGPRHHLVTSYFSNGNILQIGTELMTYTGITQEPPYRFTGLKRGAYGTRKIGPVAKGRSVAYVFQHFMTLFPDPKTPFGIEMAKHLCDICNRMGFSLVYQDGAEPFSAYDVALNRLNFSKYLDQSRGPVQIEASTWNNESWPFHSSIGAFDHPVWAMKRFHDNHLKAVRSVMRNNYISGQMGWWNPRLAGDYAEGHYVDDMEYFAAKNAAWDLPMSIQGVTPKVGPLPLSHARMMTLLGWYERSRLARAFTPEALEMLRRDRGETCLRQDASGRWTLTEVTQMQHRVGSADFRAWQVKTQSDAAAGLRVKALFGAEPYDSTNAVDLVGAGDLARMKQEAAKDVSFTLVAGDAAEHGQTLRFVAENKGKRRAGAWAQGALVYEHPFRDVRVKGGKLGGGAFGFWLKGDGSGALLDLQVKTPKIFVGGVSDHIVKIDFTGWRYVQVFLRERDTDEFYNHVWPFAPPLYAHYRQAVNLERLESVRLCLNEIPAGGRTAIEISQVKVLPTRLLSLRNVGVTVGGKRHAVPFAMESGDFAELEGGVWTRYSLGGEALMQAPADSSVALTDGVNACAFSADCDGGDPRAAVQVFAHGRSVPAFVERPAEPGHLAYEAVMPMPFDPAKGFAQLPPVRTRPGESARLEFTVYGAVTEPSVTIGEKKVVFPVTVPGDAKLVIKDGVNWQLVDYKRKVVGKGRLDSALPILKSGETAVFSAKAGTNACFAVVKRYGSSVSRTVEARTDGASEKEAEPWHGCAVKMSPSVMWATGGFGRAMAFDGREATAEVEPKVSAGDGWTVTAWVRAGAGNRAKAPWKLAGEVVTGVALPSERWVLVTVRGKGTPPAFRLGTDGATAFEGFVDDLTIRAGHLSDARISELASDAEHVDVLGYQDDGTGGIVPIKIVPRN